MWKKLYKIVRKQLPNGKIMLNQHWFDVNIVLIRQNKNIDKFPSHFDVIFWFNFDERKVDVVSKYFVRHNFDEWKKRRRLDLILMGEKSTLFWHTSFNIISMGKILSLFWFIFWCNLDGKLMRFWKTKHRGGFDITFW